MASSPKATVSIIVPCFNMGRYLGTTVHSVRQQSFQQWELIVVDDGSTDSSAASIRHLEGDDIRILAKPNAGVASARNYGTLHVSEESKYLVFLDADDIWEPSLLNTLIAHMERHPGVGMAYCACRLIGVDGDLLPEDPRRSGWFDRFTAGPSGDVQRIPASDPTTPFDAVFTSPVLLPSCTVLRRSIYEQTPGFDESFGHVFEDADLFRQMALRATVHYIDETLVQYRRHSNQSTADAERLVRQRAKLDRKWNEMRGLTATHRATIRAAEWFRDYPLAAHRGWCAGARHLRKGNIWQTLRFFGGAARRQVLSVLRRPAEIDAS